MRREFFNNFLDYDYENIDWNVGGDAKSAPLTIVPLNKYVDVTFTYNGVGGLQYKLPNSTNNTFKSVPPAEAFTFSNPDDPDTGEFEEFTYNSKNGQYTITVLQGDYIQFKGSNCNYPKSNLKFILNEDCYLTGKCNSLSNISIQCFSYLFENCEGIIHVYEGFLPDTTLAGYCYHRMFSGCKFLEFGPKLPAMGMAEGCYREMFEKCYRMNSFKPNEAIELPAKVLAGECYMRMFKGCADIKDTPELPATTLAYSCYEGMFSGCSGLTLLPVLEVDTLANYCYASMFSGCSGIKDEEFQNFQLPATKMVSGCYNGMFQGCSGLINIPPHWFNKVTSLADSCYNGMFSWCTKLNSIPPLPKCNLAASCYRHMFSRCTKLTTIPENLLPYTSLAKYCYSDMFRGCRGLTTIPENLLPATILEYGCYNFMFSECDGLTTIPGKLLPATTLAKSCYNNMFSKCKRLVDVPENLLPATTLAKNCYKEMFLDCKMLKTHPKINATELADYCYYKMFSGCTSLEWKKNYKPEATKYGKACYGLMFFNTKYNILDCVTLKFKEWGDDVIQSGVMSELFSQSNITDEDLSDNLPINSDGKYCLPWQFNIGTKEGENDRKLYYDCYSKLFYKCTKLKTPPELPSITLADGCYSQMFAGCTSLTTVPKLPAKVVEPCSYYGMFEECTSLAKLPNDFQISEGVNENGVVIISDDVIPLVYMSGCTNMFKGCTSLTTVPPKMLPAMYFENAYTNFGAYQGMFEGCAKLKTPPELPAGVKEVYSFNGGYYSSYKQSLLLGFQYCSMFKGCTSLTTSPDLSHINNLSDYIFCDMFNGCFNLTGDVTINAGDVDICSYQGMFAGCYNLNSVSINITKFPTDHNWLALEEHNKTVFTNWLPNNPKLTATINYDTTNLFKTLGKGNDAAKLAKLQELLIPKDIQTNVKYIWNDITPPKS